MPARKPIVPIARVGDVRRIQISQAAWLEIETEYKHHLTDEIRSKIVDVTNEYLVSSVVEERAPLVSETLAYLREVSEQSVALRDLIETPREVNATLSGYNLLLNHINDHRPGDWRSDRFSDPLIALREVLGNVASACERGAAELALPEYQFRKGEAWSRWIKKLTAVLNAAGLATGARRDEDQKQASPFVLLIQGLQDLLPEHHRKHNHSTNALSAAVSLARRPAAKARP